MVSGQSLPKHERLRGRGRFDELFAGGRIGKSRLVLVRALENGLAYSRMAAMCPRVAGNAVTRNRLRRCLRAAYRRHKAEIPPGWDLAILTRRGAAEAGFTALTEDMRKAVRRALESAPERQG